VRKYVTDRPVEQRHQEVHEEHVQVARHAGHVAQQAEEADSAQDEGPSHSPPGRIVQPGCIDFTRLQIKSFELT